jgi:hypothetical protein
MTMKQPPPPRCPDHKGRMIAAATPASHGRRWYERATLLPPQKLGQIIPAAKTPTSSPTTSDRAAARTT